MRIELGVRERLTETGQAIDPGRHGELARNVRDTAAALRDEILRGISPPSDVVDIDVVVVPSRTQWSATVHDGHGGGDAVGERVVRVV